VYTLLASEDEIEKQCKNLEAPSTKNSTVNNLLQKMTLEKI